MSSQFNIKMLLSWFCPDADFCYHCSICLIYKSNEQAQVSIHYRTQSTHKSCSSCPILLVYALYFGIICFHRFYLSKQQLSQTEACAKEWHLAASVSWKHSGHQVPLWDQISLHLFIPTEDTISVFWLSIISIVELIQKLVWVKLEWGHPS